MDTHPVVGEWLVARNVERTGFETIVFTAEGQIIRAASTTLDKGPRGVWVSSPGVGAWEPTGERAVVFTIVTMISNPAGYPLGSTTVDGAIEVSDDGLTFGERSFETGLTDRDRYGVTTSTANYDLGAVPLSATLIRVNSPGFPGL